MIIRRVYQRIAYYQSQGMTQSDRVFVHYGNNLEFFVDLMAIWSLGGCVIPIDSRLTKFEVGTLAHTARPGFSLWPGTADQSISASLSDLNVRILENSDAFEDSTEIRVPSISGSQLSLDQAALILFTSGTTGQPKGVVHTHRSLRARWIALRQSLGLAKYRRTLCLLPTHFGHGLICNCLFPWLSGQDLFVVPAFKSDIVMQLGELLDKYEITFMSSVPSVWSLALKMAKPPQSQKLERVFCGSAPLSAFLWKEIQEWSGTKEVFNAYGITETGSWVAGTTVPDFTPEDGLIGEPWGAIVKILKSSNTEKPISFMEEYAPGESGYVWLNTPALMKGYLGQDDLTNQVVSQGWFMTGDIGFVDDRGWLYLRGREREEINKGGMKVYPADIDAVVERFEWTIDVCSFGYDDDPLYGQNVGVALVMKEANDQAIRALYHWTKQHLAKYQMPVRWYIVESISRTSRGKINRAKVAEVCADLTPIDLRKVLRGDL
ncbi:MAG: class I adenylate-forming enzyme family protein [Thermodesulfobacteriota bacterium]